MIVDTSAIVAIVEDEAERDRLETTIVARECRLSAVSYLETSIVLGARRGPRALTELDDWIESAGIRIEPFSVAQARIAREAFLRYGKGRHAAGLNFGDCAAYALAVESDEELLYVGDDFSATEVRRPVP